MIVTALVCIAQVLFFSFVMSQASPIWTDDTNNHHAQYATLARSLVHGHIYLDTMIADPLMAIIPNPYDPAIREEYHVGYYWDHAYYRGKYYVYFGIVPCLLLFAPYYLLTGTDLSAWIATMVFVDAGIVGFYCLFFFIWKKLFHHINYWVVLFLTIAFSSLSFSRALTTPALYCTAITSGITMMIWAQYFWCRAAYSDSRSKTIITFAFLGSLFGALSFGCRPPIGLANIALLPLICITYRRIAGSSRRWFLSAFIAPYLLIGFSLMLYNYLRFQSPFEFGQSYQITIADQHQYRSFADNFHADKIMADLYKYFLTRVSLFQKFPYLYFGGIFMNYPILLFVFIPLLSSHRKLLQKRKLFAYWWILLTTVFLIAVFESYWAPDVTERYRMDMYFITCIAAFIGINSLLTKLSGRHVRIASILVMIACVVTLITCVLFYFIPYDDNRSSHDQTFQLTAERVFTFDAINKNWQKVINTTILKRRYCE